MANTFDTKNSYEGWAESDKYGRFKFRISGTTKGNVRKIIKESNRQAKITIKRKTTAKKK